MPYRHSSYYCQDFVLQVEDALFRVPQFIVQHSEVFQDMLSVPQGYEGAVEGKDDEHPLVLHGYLAQDFEQLLKVLLPQQYPPKCPKLSADEWMSVLKLAKAWNIDEVQKTAIDALDKCARGDPIFQLIVAKRFDLPQWFVPAILELARHAEPLGLKDFERLQELGSPAGVCGFVLKIAQVREGFDPAPLSTPSDCSVTSSQYCRIHSDYASGCNKRWKAQKLFRATYDFTALIETVFDCVWQNCRIVYGGPIVSRLTATSSSWDPL